MFYITLDKSNYVSKIKNKKKINGMMITKHFYRIFSKEGLKRNLISSMIVLSTL